MAKECQTKKKNIHNCSQNILGWSFERSAHWFLIKAVITEVVLADDLVLMVIPFHQMEIIIL